MFSSFSDHPRRQHLVSYLVELTEGVGDVGCSAYVSGGAVASFQPVGLDTRERIDCGIDFLIAGVFCLSLLLKRLRAPCCCCLSQRQISRAIVVIEHDHHSLDNGWPQCGLTCPAPAHVIDITPCFHNLQFKILKKSSFLSSCHRFSWLLEGFLTSVFDLWNDIWGDCFLFWVCWSEATFRNKDFYLFIHSFPYNLQK